MCGISGVVASNGIEPGDKVWLAEGLEKMSHRGPDNSGQWWSDDGKVGLGHRRLSIIDLSEAGHQPMHVKNYGLHIVFNGEIYNFKDIRNELVSLGHAFFSTTDTEVILLAYKEWGREFLSKVNGMFALAIYDEKTRKLLMARDRAGEKPLFYAWSSGNRIAFASELKGMLGAPEISGRINKNSLDCLLSMGFVPQDRCILEGVNKLPPAHALEFDLETNALDIWPYWQLPEYVDTGQNEEELLDELEALLEDSVSRQLVADVPVGVLLSGGVDSSLVTAMAARCGKKVKTYTVSFPGHDRYDESGHARLIADHFGTDHTELVGTDVSVDLLPKLAIQYDEPIVDTSMIPTFLVTQLIRQHCTVALGGDGGDELFGGYGHHSHLIWMFTKMGRIPRPIRRPIAELSGFLPVGFKGRVSLQNLSVDMRNGLPLIGALFDAKGRKRLLSKYKNWETIAEKIKEHSIPQQSDLVQRMTRMDFLNYMPEDILVKVDRASMLNSLELRAPLLDYRIIEFAFGKVPSSLKSNLNQRKIILKKMTERVLPPEFDKQRKQGFGVPIGDWLRNGEWNEFATDTLTRANGLFDKKFVLGLLDGHKGGRVNTDRIFGILMTQLWVDHYGFSI